MIPSVIATLSSHLEDNTTLLLTFFSNSIISTLYTPKKLIYWNSYKTMTFHLGILYSGCPTPLKYQFLTQYSMPLSSCCMLICQQTQKNIHLVFDPIPTQITFCDTQSCYEYKNRRVYYWSQDKQESSNTSQIGLIVTNLYVFRV